MKEFVWASKLLGCRFDLVQAGGGNTSVKVGNKLFVKASGLSVGDITFDSGYSVLSLEKIRKELFSLLDNDVQKLSKKELEVRGASILEASKLEGGRPSIETFFHALFKKYTFIHTPFLLISSFLLMRALML